MNYIRFTDEDMGELFVKGCKCTNNFDEISTIVYYDGCPVHDNNGQFVKSPRKLNSGGFVKANSEKSPVNNPTGGFVKQYSDDETLAVIEEAKEFLETVPGQLHDSGSRQTFDSGMVREPERGKPRFDLLVAENVPYEKQILTRFAQQVTHGSFKYDDRNWEKANSQAEVDRMKASAFRHFMQWYCGETDEDHAAAVMFNIMAAEMTSTKMQEDGIL